VILKTTTPKLSLYFLIILNILCQPSEVPVNTITKCIEAMTRGDYKTAYNYFSFIDKSTKTEPEFVRENEFSKIDSQLMTLTSNRIEYKIFDTTIYKDSILAILKITIPEIMRERMRYFFATPYKEKKIDSLITAEKKCINFFTIEGQVQLIKEIEGWRIYGNWRRIRDEEAKKSQVVIDYIRDSIKIAKNIRIREFQDTRRVCLEGSLKNYGKRILCDVEVMIICYEKNRKPCYILSIHPVNENEKPLKPGKSKIFQVDLSTAPATWTKEVDIKVVNCKFKD